MGESREKRRQRLEAAETALLGDLAPDRGPRRKGSQKIGLTARSGDHGAVLEQALRAHGPVERGTHGFHAYPASLHADAARDLLTLGEGPVLDPFCGGGTVLVEAVLAGREALGLDVGSVPCLVARARTARVDAAGRTQLRSQARRIAQLAMSASGTPADPLDFPEDVARAWAPHVLAELVAIRDAVGRDELLRAVFSAILVKTSRRVSETVNRLEEKPRPAGTTATLFHAKAREFARRLETMEAATGHARVHREDARAFRTKQRYGLVVTSPPYPGVYDYTPMMSLRRWWLGLDDRRALREEIGARRNFRADRSTAIDAWRADTHAWVKATARALAPGGRLVVVIGDGRVGEVPVSAWGPLEVAARDAGLRLLGKVTAERWDAGMEEVRPEHAAVWEAGA